MWDYGPDNRGPQMAAVSIAMAAMSVVAVGLRSYTMAKLLKRFLFEDILAVVTCLLQCAFSIITVMGVSYGLGAHVDHVPEVNRPKALIYKWAGQVAYIIVSTLVKFVVGIFLLRLCVNNNWQRITILVLLIVVGLFNAFYVFIAIFQCQPVEYYWYRYEEVQPVTGKCNGRALATIPTYFAVFIAIVSDLVLALLPATLIKGANLDKRTKISVCCVLALGSLASVATIARIPYAKQLLSNPDYLYNFSDLAIWSIVECGIAIIASSLATLRPLFVKMRLFASSHLTSRFQSTGLGSGGLPMQSARSGTITVISSRHAKRSTAMTGTTAMTGSTAATGTLNGLTSVKESRGGIQVEKEFEMSIMTRENSEDSIDRLEAEVNEVIRPGTAKRNASQNRFSSSKSLTPRPAPLQTSFDSDSMPSPTTANSISAGSSNSGPRYMAHNINTSGSSSPQRHGRLSNDLARSNSFGQMPPTPVTPYSGIGSAFTDSTVMRPPQAPLPQVPPRSHHHTYSEDIIRTQTPGSVLSSPNFHLPRRMHNQSIVSTQSFMSTAASYRTFGGHRQSSSEGLSAPPRHAQTATGDLMPTNSTFNTTTTNNNKNPLIASPLGSPVSLPTPFSYRNPAGNGSGSSPSSPINASPVSGVRFPPHRSHFVPDATASNYNNNNNSIINNGLSGPSSITSKSQKKPGKQRVSAFSTDNWSSSSTAETDESPHWTQRPQEESPSPLRSHPPLSPKGDWV